MRSLTLTQVGKYFFKQDASQNSHLNERNFNSFQNIQIQGYCVDSRTVKPGDLFFALKGARVDGHSFLQEVKEKGAIGAVVSKEFHDNIDGLTLFKVDDPLDSLQDLAKTVLAERPVRIVAITGSLGKTTTKEFTKTLLAAKYQVSASPGNSNSQIGVPLAILNHSTGKEDILILEMGMTHSGQISRLTQIAPPEVAVLTTAALVHACNFDSISDIVRSKAEIFSHPHLRLGILNPEMPHFSEVYSKISCSKATFSTSSPTADYFLSKSEDSVSSLLDNRTIPLKDFSLPGKHNRHNLLAAIAVARYFEVDWDLIQQAISTLALPERRLECVERGGIIFLNDSYNAAELSVKAALEAMPRPKGNGRKIAVLGSMMELGKFSESCHRSVGEFALNHVERMYCLGNECLPIVDIWKKEGRPVELFLNRCDLADCLSKELKAEDVVLLKGSRSKELWKLLDEISLLTTCTY